MSMWREIFEGFTDGFLTAAAHQLRSLPHTNGNAHAHGRIDRLCRELGWTVDERDGRTVRLHFSGRNGGTRKVSVVDGDETIVTFVSHSDAVIPAARVAPDVMAYLLRRNLNESGIGNWAMHVDDEDKVMFALIYQPLGGGIDAQAFKYICESLVNEVADFDGKMRSARLL
jgi:hypothetical protein